MTSTNDDKNVKNTTDDNATKGKSQFVEINRSLEYESLNDVPFVQRAPVLAAAWRAATCPPASPNLLRNLHRVTLLYVLQEEWPKLEESLQTDMCTSVEACANALETAGGPGVARRLRYLLRTAAHPWHHPTLRLIMDGGQPQKEQVESWFREECCAGALERLRQLCAAGGSACSGAGLRLARALLLLPAAAGARRAALDALLVLLVRAGSTTDCITEIKALDTREAVAVIARLSTRDKSSGRLWKHAHDTALLCAQVMVAACIVRPLQGGQLAALAAQLTSLYKSRPDRLSPALRKLLQPAETATHIYIVCRAVQHQFGETMRAFVCELYIRALTTGMNELERQKLQGEDSAAAKATSHELAGWFLNLADYLSSNCNVSSECVLTAFSLHPSRECYQRVEECSTKMSTTIKFQEPEDRTNLSPDEAKNVSNHLNSSGNILKTSKGILIAEGEVSDAVEGLIRLGLGVSECISEQSSKTSEKCLIDLSSDSLKKDVDDGFSDICDGNGLAQRLVSGAVLDGEGLGLTVETCRDLAVLLSGPRLKMLTWELSWKDLSRHCLSYMKDTQEGTKAVTRELKYLHLDYSQYEQIEPEVHDIYFGIEKGYEHHLEIEEEDEEDYWEEDLQDFNEENVNKSGEEHEYVDGKKETKKVKKKSSKKHIASDSEGTVKGKKPDKCKQPKKEKQPKEEKTCSKGKGKHKKVTKISPSTETIECEIVQDDAHLIRENVSKDNADDRESQNSFKPTSKNSIFESQFSAFYNRSSLSSTSFERSGESVRSTPVQKTVEKSSVPATVTTPTTQANKHISLYRLQMDRFEAWRNQRFELELGAKKDTSTTDAKNTRIKSEPESKDNSTSSVENSLCNSSIERKVYARVPKSEKSERERILVQDNSYRRYDLADGEEELIRKNVLAELLSENKSVIRTVETTRPPTIKVEVPAARSSLLAFRKNSVKKVVPNILLTNAIVPSSKISLPNASQATVPTNIVPVSKISLPNTSQATTPTNIVPVSKVSLPNTSQATIPINIVPVSKVSLPNTSQATIPTNIVPISKVNLSNMSQATIPTNIVPVSKVSLLNTSQTTIPSNIVPSSKVSLPKGHLSQLLEQNVDCSPLDSTLLRLGQQNAQITPLNSKIMCTDHSIARLSASSSQGNVNQKSSREITEQLLRESIIFNSASQRSLPKPLEDPRLELMRHMLPQTDVKVYHPKNSNQNVNRSLDPPITNRLHPDPSPKHSDQISRHQSTLNIVNKSVSAPIHKSYQQSMSKVSERNTSSTLQCQQQILDLNKHSNSQSGKVKNLLNIPPKLEVKKEPIDVSEMLVCDGKLLETWLEQKNTIRNLTQVPGYTFYNKPVYVQKPLTGEKIQKNQQLKNLANPPKSGMSAIRSAYLESVQNYPTDLLTKNDNRPTVKQVAKPHVQSKEACVKKIVKDDKQAQKAVFKTGDGSQQMKIKIANAASFDSSDFMATPRKKEQKHKLTEKYFKQQCEEMRREPAVNDALSKLNKIMDIQIQKLQSKHTQKSASSPVVPKFSQSDAKKLTKLATPQEVKTVEKNAAESQKIANPIHKIVQELQVTKNNLEIASLVMKEKQKSIVLNTAVANLGRKETNEYQTFLSEMQAMVNAGSGSQSTQESIPKDVGVEKCVDGVVTKPVQVASRKPSMNIKDLQDKDNNVAPVLCQDKQTFLINSIAERVKFSPIKITNAPVVQQNNPIKHSNTIDSSKIKEVLQNIQSKPALPKDSHCLSTRAEPPVQENTCVNNLILSSKPVKRDVKKNNSPVLLTYARKNYCSIMKKQSALKALEMALTQNQISSDDNSVALRMAPQQQLHSVSKISKNISPSQHRNPDQCGLSAGVLGKVAGIDVAKKSTPDTLQKDTDNLQVAISRLSGNNDLVVKHHNKPADNAVQEQMKKACAMTIPIVRSSVQNIQENIETKRASPKKKLKTPVSINLATTSDVNKLQAKVKSSENLPSVPKSDLRPPSIPSTSQESLEYKEPWTPLQWGLRHVKNLSDVSITHQPLPSFSTFTKKTADTGDNEARAEIPVPYFISGSAAQKTPTDVISEHLNPTLKVSKPSSDPLPKITPKTEVSKNVLLKELLSGHISINNSKFVEPLDIHSHKDASNKSNFIKEQISPGGSFKIEQTNISQCSTEPVEQKFNDTSDISDLMEIIEGDIGSHTVKPVPVEITGSERSDIHITRRDVILANLPEVVRSKSHPVLVNNKDENLANDWSSGVTGGLSQLNPESNVSHTDKNVLEITKTEATPLVTCNQQEISSLSQLNSEGNVSHVDKNVLEITKDEDTPLDTCNQNEIGGLSQLNPEGNVSHTDKNVSEITKNEAMPIVTSNQKEIFQPSNELATESFPDTVDKQLPLKSSLPDIAEIISKVNMSLNECRSTVIKTSFTKKSKPCIKRKIIIKTDKPTEVQDSASSENLLDQSIDDTENSVRTPTDDKCIAISKLSDDSDTSGHPVESLNKPKQTEIPEPLKELYQYDKKLMNCYVLLEQLPSVSKVQSDLSSSSESGDSFTILEKLSSEPKFLESPESSRDSFIILEELANECNISTTSNDSNNIMREPTQLNIPQLTDSSSIISKIIPEVSKASKVSNIIPKDHSNIEEIQKESNKFEESAIVSIKTEDSNVSEIPTSPHITESNNFSPPAVVLKQPNVITKDSHILKELQEDSSTASEVPIDSSDDTEVQKSSDECKVVLNKSDAIPVDDCISKELKEDSTASEVSIEPSNNIVMLKTNNEFEQLKIDLNKSNAIPEDDCTSRELEEGSTTSEIPIDSSDNTEVQKRCDEFEKFEIDLNKSNAILEDDCTSRELEEGSTTSEVTIDASTNIEVQKKSDEFEKFEIALNTSNAIPKNNCISREDSTASEVPIDSSNNIEIQKRCDEFEQFEIALNKSNAIPEDYCTSRELDEGSTASEVMIDSSTNIEVPKKSDEFEIALNKSNTIPEDNCTSRELREDSTASEVPIDSSDNIEVQKRYDECEQFEIALNKSNAIPEDDCTSKEFEEDSYASEVPIDSSDNIEVHKTSDEIVLNKSDAIPEDDYVSKELKEDSIASRISIDLSNNVVMQKTSDESERSEIVLIKSDATLEDQCTSEELKEDYSASKIAQGVAKLQTDSIDFSSPAISNQSDSISDASSNELRKESDASEVPNEFSPSTAIAGVITDEPLTMRELQDSIAFKAALGSVNNMELPRESKVFSPFATAIISPDAVSQDSSNLKELPEDYKITNSCNNVLMNETNELSITLNQSVSDQIESRSILKQLPEVSKHSPIRSKVSKEKLNTIYYSSKISKEILLEDSSGSESLTDSSESDVEEQSTAKPDIKLSKVVKIILTRVSMEHLKSIVDNEKSEEFDKSTKNVEIALIEENNPNQMINTEPIEISKEEISDVILIEGDELPPKDNESEKLKTILPPENIVKATENIVDHSNTVEVESTQTISPKVEDKISKQIPIEVDEIIDLISDDEVEMYIPDDPIGLDYVEESVPEHVDVTLITPSFITVVDAIKNEELNIEKQNHKYGLRRKRVNKSPPPPFLVFAGKSKFIKVISVPLEDQKKLKMICCVNLANEDLPKLREQSNAKKYELTFGAQNLYSTKLEGKKEEVANTSKRKQSRMETDPEWKQVIITSAVKHVKLNQNKNESLPNKRMRQEKIKFDDFEVKSEQDSASSDTTYQLNATNPTSKTVIHFQPIEVNLKENSCNLMKEKFDLNSNKKVMNVKNLIVSSIQKDIVTGIVESKCSEKPSEGHLSTSSEIQAISDTIKLESLDKNDSTNVTDFTDSDNFNSDWKTDVKNETDDDDDENNKKDSNKDINIQENTPFNDKNNDLRDSFRREFKSSSDESFPSNDSSNTEIVSSSTFFTAFQSFVTDNQTVVDSMEYDKPDALSDFEESSNEMSDQEISSKKSFENIENSDNETLKPDILPSTTTIENSDNQALLLIKVIGTSEKEPITPAARNVSPNGSGESLKKCDKPLSPCPDLISETTDDPNIVSLQPDIIPNCNSTSSPELISTVIHASGADEQTSLQEMTEISVKEKDISILSTDLTNCDLETETMNHIIIEQSIENLPLVEQTAGVGKSEKISESDEFNVHAKEILHSVIDMVCAMEKDLILERNDEIAKTQINIEVQILGGILTSPKIAPDEEQIDKTSPKQEVTIEKQTEISKTNNGHINVSNSLSLPKMSVEVDQIILPITNSDKINIKIKSSVAHMIRNGSHDAKMDDRVTEMSKTEGNIGITERLLENNPLIVAETKTKRDKLCEINIEEPSCSAGERNILDNSEITNKKMRTCNTDETPVVKFDYQESSVVCMSIVKNLDSSNSQFENIDTDIEYEMKEPIETLDKITENTNLIENSLEEKSSSPEDTMSVPQIMCETNDLSSVTNAEEKSSIILVCQNEIDNCDMDKNAKSLENNPGVSNEINNKVKSYVDCLVKVFDMDHDGNTDAIHERISENNPTSQIPGELKIFCHADISSSDMNIRETPQGNIIFFEKSEIADEKIELHNANEIHKAIPISKFKKQNPLLAKETKEDETMEIISYSGSFCHKFKEKSSSPNQDDEEMNLIQEETEKSIKMSKTDDENMDVTDDHVIGKVDGNENKIKEESSIVHMVKEEMQDMDISEDVKINISDMQNPVEISKEDDKKDFFENVLKDNSVTPTPNLGVVQIMCLAECSSKLSIKKEPCTVEEANILDNLEDPDEKTESPNTDETCKQSEKPTEIFDKQNSPSSKVMAEDIKIKEKSSILCMRVVRYLDSSDSHDEKIDKNIEFEKNDPIETSRRVEENINLLKHNLEGKSSSSNDTIEEPRNVCDAEIKDIKSSSVSMIIVRDLALSEHDSSDTTNTDTTSVLSKRCLEGNHLSFKNTVDELQTEKPSIVLKCWDEKTEDSRIDKTPTPLVMSEAVVENDERIDMKKSGNIIDAKIAECDDIQKIFDDLANLEVIGFREENVFKNPIKTYQKAASSSNTRKRKMDIDMRNLTKNPRINLPVTQDRNVTSVDEVVYDNLSVKEILMMDDIRDNLPETTKEDLEVVSFDKTKFEQNDFLFDAADVSNFDTREESPRESFYSPIFTEDERNRDAEQPVDDFIMNNIDMEDLNGERKTDGSGFREGFGFRSGREDTSDLLHGRPHGTAAALPDSLKPRLPRTPLTSRASQNAEESTTSKVRKLLVMQANSENRFDNCLLEKRARKHSKKARKSVSPLGNRNRIKEDLLKKSAFSDLKETKMKLDNKTKFDKSYKYSDWSNDIFSRIPGMRDLDFIRPTPIVAVVNVVQLGQLPVSSAQQSPMPGTPTRPNTTGEYLDIASNNSAEYRSPTHEDSRQSGNHENELPDLNESNAEGSVKNHNADDSANIETNDINNAVNESPKTEDKHFDNAQNSSETVAVQDALNLSTSTSGHMMDGNVQLIFTSQPLTQHTYVTSDVQSEHKEVSRENIIETSINSMHTTNANFIPVSRAQTLVNILSQKILRPPVSGVGTQQLQMATFPKGTPINALSLQQALAQILPPPLSQASSDGSTSVGHSSGPQVVHIVQGKTGGQPGSSFSGLLMDSSQQSVVSASGGTQVLHIVQGKNTTATSNSGVIGQTQLSGATFGGLSLVDGSQQSGNQVLHILNAGSQTKHNAAATQLLKRVNLLTSLTNTQGNEQKMVQFLCKSADGKSIQLSSQHQRGMVLRLQPIQSETSATILQKTSESLGVITNATPMQSGIKKSPQSDQSQEIKSRSIYEENYAKFIQNSSSKLSPISPERSTSLPKFNQAFGKSVFQDSNSVPKNNDSVECTQNQAGPVSNEQQAQDLSTAINLAQMGQLSSPPLLIRKTHQPGSTQNLVGQVKPSGTPMNIQTMHGGVIYTRQIPVNIGGGQTINLITVPSSDIIDEAHLQAIQKQAQEKANMGDEQQQVIKLVSQEQQQQSNVSVCHMDSASDDANQGFAEQTQNTINTHPLLTQMRIKVPMLSKGGTQMVAGTRVVRPVLQIQRNVIPGTNPAVYQQLVLTTAPALRPPTPAPQQPVRPPRPPTTPQQESNLSSSTLEQLREFDMVLEQVKERSTVQPGSNSNSAFSESSPQRQSVDNSDIISSQPNVGQTTQREVLYSIGPNQTVNVTYVNQKVLTSTASVLGSSYSSNPESPAIVNIGQQNSPSLQIAHGLSNSINHPKPNTPTKISTKSMKPKTSKPPSNITPSSSKASPVAPKTSLQKPLEDEQTTQRILYILAEYKEQVENSPDKDKPAPRRRSNPPTNPSTSSKRKKGSSSSSKKGGNGQSMQEMSPSGDDTGHTMGSEDSSCGLSQGDCADNSIQGPESQSPQGSPQKAARKLVFPQEQEVNATPVTQPQRNIVIADGQTIAMTRPGPGGKATAVLMPANYLLPMSMMKGGQQITIVTNQGPKILSVPHGEGGTTNTLFLQRLISPAGLKPMLTRPGQVRQVRLPANTVQNLQAFNLTTSNTNNQDISWIGSNSLNNQQPKLLVEYSPNVTVAQDLNPDSVKSEASDAQSLKEENMSVGSESLATPRHSDSREALSDDLNMKNNRSGDEGIFSGQTDSATDDSIQSSIQNRTEQILQHIQMSKNTTNHTVNLIQVHSLNPNEPGKIFSVQNPASLGSLIQLAGKTSLGQAFQTINVSGMDQDNSKISQEVQECAQNLLLVRKQFDGQFAVNEAAVNDADLKSSSSIGMQQDLQSVDASPSPGSQQNYGLGHGDQLDDGHSLKVNSDANVPWSLTSNGGSTVSHGGDGASPAYVGYGSSPPSLSHHRDNGMREHSDDGRVLRHPYSPETESPTPGAPRHLYHKMFISSPDKQDHIGNDDKGYHHEDHHHKKEDNSQSSTITLHTSNSPSFTIHHHQHHSSAHTHHAQPHHHHAQQSHHHAQPPHHGKGAEGRGSSGAEHGGRSGSQGSVPAHVLRHKYALIEHELRLQKSLSEECEDLGVDSPSASDLFPEAELLFAASPSSQFDQSQDGQAAAPPLPLVGGLKEDHIGPVEEEFARMHPNTTFHSGEIEIGGDDAEDISFRGSAAKRSAARTQLNRRNEVVRSVIEGVGSSGMPTSYQPSKMTTHFSMVGLPRRTLNVMSSLQSSDDNSEGADSMNSESKDGLVNNKHLDGMLNSDIARDVNLAESPGCIASNIIQRNVAQVIRHANEGQLSLAGKDNTGKLCNESSPGIAQNGRSFLLESSNDTRPGDSMILKTLMMERDGRDGLTCSSPEQHSELFWESNSNSNQSEEPLPHHGPTNLLDFSSEDSNKCCKSPASCEETNSTDSSSIGGHNAESHKPLRLNSVIKTGNSSSAADGPILHSALTANLPNISGQDTNRKLDLNTSHNDSNTSTSPDGEDPNLRRTWGRSLKSSGMRRVLSPRSLSAEINMGAEIETSSSEGVNILTKQSGGSVMHSGSSTPEETVPAGRRASLRGTGQARRSCHCCPPPSPAPHAPQSSKGRARRKPPPTAH